MALKITYKWFDMPIKTQTKTKIIYISIHMYKEDFGIKITYNGLICHKNPNQNQIIYIFNIYV